MSIETYAQDLGPDERSDWFIEHDETGYHTRGYFTRCKPHGLAILADVAAWVVHRAELVLPDVPLVDAVPYIVALQAHAARPDGETFTDLLASALGLDGAERLTLDDANRADVFTRAAALTYLQPDDDLYRVPAAPIDAVARAARRTNGTVVGRRDAYVIGNGVTCVRPDGTVGEQYGRMSSAECLERAHLLMVANGGDTPLIGTDAYSWEQIVSFKPETFTLEGVTINGAPVGAFVFAPYGAGASTTGDAQRNAYGATKRRSHSARVARYVMPVLKFPKDGPTEEVAHAANGRIGQAYNLRAEEVTTLAWDADFRIVKRYRTAFDGRYIVGHGAWQGTPRAARKAASVKRAAIRASVPVCATETALAHLERVMSDAFITRTATTYTVRTDTGVTLKAEHDPAGRSFRLTTTDKRADSVKRSTTKRVSLAGTLSVARRAVA